MSEKQTLYIVELGKFGSDLSGMLMTAEGENLGSHLSSSSAWLKADLTENFGRGYKLRERFGEYDLVYVAGNDPLPEQIAHHFNTGAEEA